MPNNEFTIKRGASSAILIATLSDEDGEVDLTGFQGVEMVAARTIGMATPEIDGVACVIDPDQVANTGKVRFFFDATTANIPLGEYYIEFYGTDAGGDVHIFPTGGPVDYGKLYVLESLA
jgi:hypothetical protein